MEELEAQETQEEITVEAVAEPEVVVEEQPAEQPAEQDELQPSNAGISNLNGLHISIK